MKKSSYKSAIEMEEFERECFVFGEEPGDAYCESCAGIMVLFSVPLEKSTRLNITCALCECELPLMDFALEVE